MVLMEIYSLTGQDLNPGYDSTLARKLGADDYGMKTYVLVILKTGSKEIKDQVLRDSLFAGHFKNIYKMADEGKLAVAEFIRLSKKVWPVANETTQGVQGAAVYGAIK